MYNADIEKISKMIENFEALKKAKEQYQRDCPSRLQYRFYNEPPGDRENDRTYGPWLRSIQPLVDKIKSGLDDLYSCIILHGRGNWSVDGIKFAVDSYINDLRKSDILDSVIGEFKAIKKTLEGKSQSTETEQELPPNYKTCLHIGGIIGKRSDVVARTLKAHHYPVIKKARKNYCDPDHAAIIWPKYKQYLKKKANLL